MANTYKNIVITPNRSSNTADPKVVYSGGNTTANTDITLYVYPDSNGSLSWEGSAGQLFSITNDLSNNLFGVNDVSGIPSLEVYANGLVSIAPFGGNVVIGNTAELILSPGTGLHANGSFGTAGHVLHTNGSAVYWAADDNSGGTVTSVATGNGMTGGPVTTTGTVSVLANTGIVANTTGVFVNATYIGTLSANNTTYVNGKTEGNLNVNSAVYANASITNTFTVGTGTYFVSNGNVGIGITNPAYRLQVVPSFTGDGIFSTASDGSLTRIGLYNSNRAWSISNYGTAYSPNGRFAIADESAGAVRFAIDTSGSVTAFVDYRAPIFYDSDNTAYYADPNSLSRMNSIFCDQYRILNGGLFIWQNSAGATNQKNWDTYAGNDVNGTLTFRAVNDAYSAANSWLTVTRSGFDPQVITLGGIYTTAAGSLRAPLFYDSDNTGYYVDPAGTSILNTQKSFWTSYTDNWNVSNDGKNRFYFGANARTYFGSQNGYEFRSSTDGNIGNLDNDGTFYNYASVRSPLFYDQNNTAYYVDPASTSNINGLTVAGTITGSISGSAGTFTSTTQNSQFNSIGVNTAASGTAGEIRATNNITAYYSDKRLKNILGLISSPLEKIKKLSGIVYKNNDVAKSFGYEDEYEQVGVIAQEVEKVLPQIVKLAPFDTKYDNGKEVSISGENYKTVQYEKLIPLLIEAIKEQQEQIDELKCRLENN